MQRSSLEWRAASLDAVGQRWQARAYYVIDREGFDGSATFRVWRRGAGMAQAEMLGEHSSLAMAKSSLPVRWRDAASTDLEAWGFWQPSVLPEEDVVDARD